MTDLCVITKNHPLVQNEPIRAEDVHSSLREKPRVYFTCHPEDFGKYFHRICKDIFKTHDCAIYYTEDMAQPIADEDKKTILGQHNLFVVPVTLKLLTTPNRAMDQDIPYAIANRIPILPLMMGSGLGSVYALPDKFGKLQYLIPGSQDPTQIPYAQKLRQYLDSVLTSDQVAACIRAAFDAHIFLSYRKTDRRYANELMTLIHDQPQCHAIAIWFDEFLTPGESFKDNIVKMLNECDLFTLLVTPQLFLPGIRPDGTTGVNYVLSTELPLAREKEKETGQEILAVEMEKTDQTLVSSLALKNCLHAWDAAFPEALSQALSQLACSENDAPEHTFLVGLAYLDGIDVEVDHPRAVDMITKAATDGLPEAMKKLCQMYLDGYGVKLSYADAAHWAKKYADKLCQLHTKEDLKTISALSQLANIHQLLGQHQAAKEILEDIYPMICRILGVEHPHSTTILNNLSLCNSDLGAYKLAMEQARKVYHIRCRSLDAEDEVSQAIAMNNLATVCHKTGDYREEQRLLENAHKIFCKIKGQTHPHTITALNNLAAVYGDLGQRQEQLQLYQKVLKLRQEDADDIHPEVLHTKHNLAAVYYELGQYDKALSLQQEVYDLRCQILGENHPDTLNTLGDLANTHCVLANYQKALTLQKKVYDLRCGLLGAEHPESLLALSNLASIHQEMGDLHTAQTMRQTVYDLRCKVLGEEHPQTLISLNQLASAYDKLGDSKQALLLHQKAYAATREKFTDEHPDTLMALSDIANSYSELGKADAAFPLRQRVYTLCCKLLPAEHPQTLAALHELASAYYDIGNFPEALKHLKNAHRLRSQVLGVKHPDTLTSLHNLASTHQKLKNFKESLKLEQKAYAYSCEVLGKEHPDTLKSLNALAYFTYAAGDAKESMRLQKLSYTLQCQVLGKEHPQTIAALNNLAMAYYKRKDYEEATKRYEEAYALCCQVFGHEHPNTRGTTKNLMDAYFDWKAYEKLTDFLEPIFARIRTQTADSHYTDIANSLAIGYYMQGKYTAAIAPYEYAYQFCCDQYGLFHSQTLTLVSNLARCYEKQGMTDKVLALLKKHALS